MKIQSDLTGSIDQWSNYDVTGNRSIHVSFVPPGHAIILFTCLGAIIVFAVYIAYTDEGKYNNW